ncbi:MAG: galactokinase [Chitinophagaceae bacterium]|nr:galactokinase [Chitinophagaceae bacterium]
MNPIAANVATAFTAAYQHTPQLYFSPGRINLIGEHVDYNDGFVLPAAINKGVYYAVAANTSGLINISALDYNEQISIPFSDINKTSGWRNYVLSVVNEFLLLHKNIGGFDCIFSGDIPIGSGMSSSAAVEGGLAFALNEIFNAGLSRKELALLCQRAEHNFPNMKCGIMDQYANLQGKKDNVILLDCKTIEHQYYPLLLGEYIIVLINSNVHHELVTGEYNLRRKWSGDGLNILKNNAGVQSFRDKDIAGKLETCKASMSSEEYNCCKYVIEEIARTQLAVELLAQNNLRAFGQLMNATHLGLSKLYTVSCKELDFLADYAATHEAVLGSRMMGGGFGGCTINIVRKDSTAQFIEAISAAYLQQFNIKAEAYIVETSNGVEKIAP